MAYGWVFCIDRDVRTMNNDDQCKLQMQQCNAKGTTGKEKGAVTRCSKDTLRRTSVLCFRFQVVGRRTDAVVNLEIWFHRFILEPY